MNDASYESGGPCFNNHEDPPPSYEEVIQEHKHGRSEQQGEDENRTAAEDPPIKKFIWDPPQESKLLPLLQQAQDDDDRFNIMDIAENVVSYHPNDIAKIATLFHSKQTRKRAFDFLVRHTKTNQFPVSALKAVLALFPDDLTVGRSLLFEHFPRAFCENLYAFNPRRSLGNFASDIDRAGSGVRTEMRLPLTNVVRKQTGV